MAFDAYSYGAESGQIKQLSDHSHIIPLYDLLLALMTLI